MDALHRLENLGVRVVNSASSIERTVDKYYTSFLLADAEIPTPRTLVTEDFEAALAACREMKDVVVKPLFGSEGKGIVRVNQEPSESSPSPAGSNSRTALAAHSARSSGWGSHAPS